VGQQDKNGNRPATITVKVTNHGPYRSNSLVVGADYDPSSGKVIPGLAVGRSTSVTITVIIPGDETAAEAKGPPAIDAAAGQRQAMTTSLRVMLIAHLTGCRYVSGTRRKLR
jgi:CARDB